MKRLLIVAAATAALLSFSAAPSQAQFYSGYTYNNNAYLNYAIASSKANATRRHASKTKANKTRKRNARRAHHVSRTGKSRKR